MADELFLQDVAALKNRGVCSVKYAGAKQMNESIFPTVK